MKSTQWKCGVLAVPLVLGGVVATACGGGASSAPPASAANTAVATAPVASDTATPVATGGKSPTTMPQTLTDPGKPQTQVAEPTGATAEVSTPEENEQVAAELVDHLRHHHHGGVGMFLAMSLDTLGTTPDQHEAIEKIQTNLRTKLEPARDAERKVMGLLADGVAVGKIDQPKVDAAIARLGTAATGVHPAVLDALNQLHAVLNPAQRTALVDKIEADFEVWREANAPVGDAAEKPEHARLDTLTRELSLSPEQVDKIKTHLKTGGSMGPKFDPEKITAHITALGDAFEADTFDAKKLGPNEGVSGHMATWATSGMARFYEAVAPVLTPDQRAKLAERIRDHATHKEAPEAG
jgi:Spy/CpxP family protein refolding chaperone